MKIYNASCSKSVYSLLILFICTLGSNAQINYSKQYSPFWNHVHFGGGLGLSFGDGFFSGTVAPSAIYTFNDFMAAGIGLNGTYAKQRDFYSATILGGSIIGLFNPIHEIQFSTEFEQLNVTRRFENFDGANTRDSYWYPALFLGLGYNTGNVTFGIRYDVLYDEGKSIYADAYMPFIRVYF